MTNRNKLLELVKNSFGLPPKISEIVKQFYGDDCSMCGQPIKYGERLINIANEMTDAIIKEFPQIEAEKVWEGIPFPKDFIEAEANIQLDDFDNRYIQVFVKVV